MLDANLKAQLASYLQRMTGAVEITASLDDTQASKDMRALLQDIADASPGVSVTEVAISSSSPGSTVRLR